MTLPLPPTLAEVRQAVADRMGWGAEVQNSHAIHPTIDEWIRSAAKMLMIRQDWLEMRHSVDVDLVDGQRIYDIPDGLLPGNIEEVIVLDTDGHLFPMVPGSWPDERSQWADDNASNSLPRTYEFINDDMVIYPAPDATQYPTIRFRGYFLVEEPRNTPDRIPIDKEALILKATSIGKKAYSMPDAREVDQDLAVYLTDLKAAQSDGSGFIIGRRRSTKFHRSTSRNLSDNAAYDYHHNLWWWETYRPFP